MTTDNTIEALQHLGVIQQCFAGLRQAHGGLDRILIEEGCTLKMMGMLAPENGEYARQIADLKAVVDVLGFLIGVDVGGLLEAAISGRTDDRSRAYESNIRRIIDMLENEREQK